MRTKEQRREYDKARRDANPEKGRQQCRTWHAANRERRKADKLRLRYGITPDERVTILDSQGGHCALCAWTVGLVVDHDHVTGRVRGLLCRGHNATIKHLGDDEAGLLRALAYVRGT